MQCIDFPDVGQESIETGAVHNWNASVYAFILKIFVEDNAFSQCRMLGGNGFLPITHVVIGDICDIDSFIDQKKVAGV